MSVPLRNIKTDMCLAVAGGAEYKGNTREREFLAQLKGIADSRVKFLGHVDSVEEVQELHCNCYAYVHGHQFGGINPSLLKALGCGNMILALNTPFNAEVLDNGRFGILFERDAAALREQRPDVAVMIRGETTVPHGRMADIYEACRGAGVRRVAISVRPRSEAVRQ